MNKKIKFNKNKMNDIKGFEEVMDLVLDENGQIEELKKRKELERYNDTYELYNFLENEKIRLEKIDDLFSKKVPNLLIHSQTKRLIQLSKEKKAEAICDLLNKVTPENSYFNQHMDSIYNGAFSQGRSGQKI